jgi:hypothetical protein
MFVSVEVLDDLDREAVLMGPGMELLENGSHAAVGVSGPLALADRRSGRSIARRFYPIRRCASTYRATNDDRFEHGALQFNGCPPSPHVPDLVDLCFAMISPIREYCFDGAEKCFVQKQPGAD